jgi:import inner membrane translocase subunit TIM21
VAYFNRAVDRIKKDPRCVELLGPGNKIVAYGEETYNKWRRARPIASTETRDPQGNEHLLIHFNVRHAALVPPFPGVPYLETSFNIRCRK